MTGEANELDQFRAETRAWLDANCPEEMRQPVRDEGDVYWGGRNAEFKSDAQRRWLQAAGVEVLQGHLFGCALPQEAFSARYLSPAREDVNL